MNLSRMGQSRLVKLAVAVLVWLVASVVAFVPIFTSSQRESQIAGHRAVIAPQLGAHSIVRSGPVLPDVRFHTFGPVGVEITLGNTEVDSIDALVNRYAVVASHPEGQVAIVKAAMADMAVSAALRAAVVGVLPVLVWLLLGRRRRAELRQRLTPRAGLVAALAVTLAAVAIWQPWVVSEVSNPTWVPLTDVVAADLPDALRGVEISGDAATEQYVKLIESGIDTFTASEQRYAKAIAQVPDLILRQPEPGEEVAILLTDRHDNIGMDPVARAVADKAGATTVYDGGDDTSTGSEWEAFSLDSVNAAFADFDRFAVAGNHDHGGFVTSYLSRRGWTALDLEVVEGPAGSLLTGVDDPRSSGLGAWRKRGAVSFKDVEIKVADSVCAAPRRVNTLLVHDANLGREALRRGCVDLVIGGHVHVRVGPNLVRGPNDAIGYTYTNGTTGGAAYAIALGRIRRDATLTLITYRDGRPVGIQPVVLQTNDTFQVGEYVELVYSADDLANHPQLTESAQPTPTPPP